MKKYYHSVMSTLSCLTAAMLLFVLPFYVSASITNVSATSGRNYQVSTLQIGGLQYTDRNFTLTEIADLGGQQYIKTANSDKYSTGTNFLTFTITEPGYVCVAHDDRITQKPLWLSSFTLTTANLQSTDGHPFSIYTKYYPAGIVALGGNLPGSSGSNISMYSVVVVDEPRPTVSNIQVANGRTYELSTVALGEEQYVDREYVFTQINPLGGYQFIKAFNNDKNIVSNAFLSFTIDRAAVIYVAHDDRITTKPSWLLDFTDTGVNIQNSDDHHPMSVYQKVFPAGVITLGGNVVSPIGSNISMYTVIIGDAIDTLVAPDASGL